jgi:hypothetical protein
VRLGFYAARANNIIALLGIDPGYFAHDKAGSGCGGGGVERAARDLAKHREAQRERLKDAPPAEVTRQQLRSRAIRGRR